MGIYGQAFVCILFVSRAPICFVPDARLALSDAQERRARNANATAMSNQAVAASNPPPRVATPAENATPVGVLMTPGEYLIRERAADGKSEYRNGMAFAMSGVNITHATITGNLHALLWNRVRDGLCGFYGSDLRMSDSENKRYFYPDLTIVCGDPTFQDDAFDTLTNPAVIVEVLSSSTESRDRGEKFREYQRITSLREYVLVSQTERTVERFLRQENSDLWIYSLATGETAVARFETIGAEIPLADIYENVHF